MAQEQSEDIIPPQIFEQLENLEDAINEEISGAIHEFHAANGAVVINPITRKHSLNILRLLKPYLVVNKQAIDQAVAEARIDQIQQDFLCYSMNLDVDESELIAIRDQQLHEQEKS